MVHLLFGGFLTRYAGWMKEPLNSRENFVRGAVFGLRVAAERAALSFETE
jgi:hypothetical protein